MSDPEIIKRSEWTSASRGGAAITSSNIRGLVNHWPAHPHTIGTDKSKIRSLIRSWWNYHVNTHGWSDIGYNFGIDQAGRIWDLRGLWRIGAHCASPSNPSANHYWIGVLFIVGNNERPSKAMIKAYQYLRHEIVYKAHGSDANEILGHRQVSGAQTTCPGDVIIGLEGELNNDYEQEEPELTIPENMQNELARETNMYRRSFHGYVKNHWPETAKKWKNGYTLNYYAEMAYARTRRIVEILPSRKWKESIAYYVWYRVNEKTDLTYGRLTRENHEMLKELISRDPISASKMDELLNDVGPESFDPDKLTDIKTDDEENG